MSLVFILDTDVISELSKPDPDPVIVEFLVSANDIRIPSAALMEIQKGIAQVSGRNPEKAVKLSSWYRNITSGSIPILPSDDAVFEMWGILAADPRLQNLMTSRAGSKQVRSGQDLHIAAAALVNRMAIATCNVDDFMMINSCHPLPGIFNPRTGVWHTQMEPLWIANESSQYIRDARQRPLHP